MERKVWVERWPNAGAPTKTIYSFSSVRSGLGERAKQAQSCKECKENFGGGWEGRVNPRLDTRWVLRAHLVKFFWQGDAGQCHAGLSGASRSTSRCSPGHLCPPGHLSGLQVGQPRARSSLAAAQIPSSTKLGGPGMSDRNRVTPHPPQPPPPGPLLLQVLPEGPGKGSELRGGPGGL